MIRFLSSIIALFSLAQLCAQNGQPTVPKLVVGITIDQLRGDYLEMFRHSFGDKGFNRLLNHGLVYSNVEFDFPDLDRASTIATIYTGANPSYHGITAENIYNINRNTEEPTYADNNYLGNFTSQKLSPLALKVSTIADELAIASGGQSDIFAFAPYSCQAFASGGQGAKGAFWIEDSSGDWATTTFYTTKQPVVEQHNRSGESLRKSISGKSWRPAIDVTKYNAFPYTKNIYNFQHFFGDGKKNKISHVKQSPFVNTEVRAIAEKMIVANSLGKRMNPDFVGLTFYAGNFENALDKNYSVEIQDIYYRLDKEIATLLDVLDRQIGLKNVLIFVSSTGYFDELEILPKGMKTSGGIFRPERTLSLLNMYLMALYGREQWIKKYYDEQIFFDRKLIEDKKIDLGEFQRVAAEFLVMSEGIHDVITSHQMLHGAYNQTVQYYRNGFFKDKSGDLFLELQPGWEVVEDNQTEDSYRVRNNAVASPVIFFGNNIKATKIDRTIKATEIAPTVCHRLRIRAPNAAKGEILSELFY